MADFCKQCSIDNFGSDLGDLAGLGGKDDVFEVLCEGCGFYCIVNQDGTCISEHCLKKHGLGDESARVEQWAANYLDCQTETYDGVQ